jgi:hypothetical protein
MCMLELLLISLLFLLGPSPKRMRLLSFNFKNSVTPMSVPLPELFETGDIPPFIASGDWMTGLCTKVLTNANLQDSESPRVTPVAVTRCSRGGKTRSLHELTRGVEGC